MKAAVPNVAEELDIGVPLVCLSVTASGDHVEAAREQLRRLLKGGQILCTPEDGVYVARAELLPLEGATLSGFNSTISTNRVNPISSTSAPPVGGAIWVTSSGGTSDLDYVTIADNTLTPFGGTAGANGQQCDGTCSMDDTLVEDPCVTSGTLTFGPWNVDAGAAAGHV